MREGEGHQAIKCTCTESGAFTTIIIDVRSACGVCALESSSYATNDERYTHNADHMLQCIMYAVTTCRDQNYVPLTAGDIAGYSFGGR